MSLIRWEPFSSSDDLFNRMLPSLFGRWTGNGIKAEMEWAPTADISETDKEYLIRAELPAVNKEDVKVTVDGTTLTIEGERKKYKEEKSEKFHRVESFHGSFARSFTLPEGIDGDAVTCQSKDGVLTVHIPKKPEVTTTAKRIPVA